MARAVEISKNVKTGRVSATYAGIIGSCHKRCPLIRKGCYARTSYTGMIQRKEAKREHRLSPVLIARMEAKAIDRLSGRRALRLHVSGDARTNAAARVLAAAAERFAARAAVVRRKQSHAGKVWSYTHAWRSVNRSSWGKVSVLASCETTADIKMAHAAGWGAAVVVAEFKSSKAWVEDGVKLIPCPAQTREDVLCTDCQLCWKDQFLLDTQAAVAFEAHGSEAKAVRQTLIRISGVAA